MDAKAVDLFDFVPHTIEALLGGQRPDYGVLPCGWLPLDIDTFADQACRDSFPCKESGRTAKVVVSHTYAVADGYCLLTAYLGSHGFCLLLALRPDVQHSAAERGFNLKCVIPMAQRLSVGSSKALILARLASGFDAA